MKRMIYHIFFAALCVVCLLGFSVPARAESGSVTLKYPVPDVAFELYCVGTYSHENTWELTEELADLGIDLTGKNAATTLAAYVADQEIAPIAMGRTDEEGILVFEGLEHAAYLIVGRNATVDHTTYTASPVLLSLPGVKGDSLVWDVEVNGKYESRQFTELKVVKVWEKDTEEKRPKSVTVKLLKGDETVGEVELSGDNNWTHEWPDLDADAEYQVVEENVPEGYLVSVEYNGSTAVVTNTYQRNPEKIPESTGDSGNGGGGGGKTNHRLPQTGQLWWPVGISLCVGLFLILMGMMIYKKNEN